MACPYESCLVIGNLVRAFISSIRSRSTSSWGEKDELQVVISMLIESHRRAYGDGLLSHIHTCSRNGFGATEGRLYQGGMRGVGTQMTCCFTNINPAGLLRDQSSALYLVEFVEGQVVLYKVADSGGVVFIKS